MATAAWGRRNLGQFPKEDANEIYKKHCYENATKVVNLSDANNDDLRVVGSVSNITSEMYERIPESLIENENENKNENENDSKVEVFASLSIVQVDKIIDIDDQKEVGNNINMNEDVIDNNNNNDSNNNNNDNNNDNNNNNNDNNNDNNNNNNNSNDNNCIIPQKLSLPNGLEICEVWAGSEYSIVADERGYLWSSGWNEHGNLGRGPGSDFILSDGWLKVMRREIKSMSKIGRCDNDTDNNGYNSYNSNINNSNNKSNINNGNNGNNDTTDDNNENIDEDVRNALSTTSCNTDKMQDEDVLQHVQLSVLWEGALACGGGHVLCLTDL